MNTIRTFAAEDATIIYGGVYDDALGDDLRVTVVATGLGRPLAARASQAAAGGQQWSAENRHRQPARLGRVSTTSQLDAMPAVIRAQPRLDGRGAAATAASTSTTSRRSCASRRTRALGTGDPQAPRSLAGVAPPPALVESTPMLRQRTLKIADPRHRRRPAHRPEGAHDAAPGAARHGHRLPARRSAAPVDIPARAELVGDTRLASTPGAGRTSRSTPSSTSCPRFAGLGVDNAYVDLDAPEVPIMDGSASPFVLLIQPAGIERAGARPSASSASCGGSR